MTAQPVAGEFPLLAGALTRCLDTIETCAVPQADQCGWGTWELDQRGEPSALSAARPSLYDGNAGIAWALRTLARDSGPAPAGRTEATPGLLGGSTGVCLAAGVAPRPERAGRGSDLGGGLAGDLLALVRTGSPLAEVAPLVAALVEAARWDGEGCCWPDSGEGEALCGLAHGVSGVILALAEATAAFPELGGRALPLVSGGLRWEAAWFDPVSGGWPDLRGGGPVTYPVMWCHGAAGIAAVRLRLLQLHLPLDYPVDAVRAEAHAGVLACGRELTRVAARARTGGLAAVPGGLTLCHGLGGPLDVLVLAGQTWHDPAHLHAARRIASDLLTLAPDDPLEWPTGLRVDGCLGLFVGTAGTALLLGRLLEPERIGSLSLLAF